MSEQTKQPTVHHTGAVNVVVNNQGQAGILQRNWLMALLLSIFLGWLGIDRFYLGSAGVGVVKLLTFGVFGVMWVIDVIMIATKSIKGIEWVE